MRKPNNLYSMTIYSSIRPQICNTPACLPMHTHIKRSFLLHKLLLPVNQTDQIWSASPLLARTKIWWESVTSSALQHTYKTQQLSYRGATHTHTHTHFVALPLVSSFSVSSVSFMLLCLVLQLFCVSCSLFASLCSVWLSSWSVSNLVTFCKWRPGRGDMTLNTPGPVSSSSSMMKISSETMLSGLETNIVWLSIRTAGTSSSLNNAGHSSVSDWNPSVWHDTAATGAFQSTGGVS